jgi:phytoene synthase
VRYELKRYWKWQEEAEEGFKYIPKKFLTAIKTASDMYKWTAKEIEKNPRVVLEKQIKPSKYRILMSGVWNKFAI